MKILLVDDDRELTAMVAFTLRRGAMSPLEAHDLPGALELFEQEKPDLVVLDINLGAWDGLEVLKELRRRGRTPVIMLTGRASEDDKVHGLELGADDYLAKPFSHRELVARIRARLRSSGASEKPWRPPTEQVEVGPLTLNVPEHAVTKDGEPINLTAIEFRLLHLLMTKPGRVVRTSELLQHVWGHGDPSAADVVRVTLYRLRRKLEADPARPQLIHTVPGVGVMLKADGVESTQES